MDFTKLNKTYIFGAHSRARTLAVYLTKLYPALQIKAFLVDNEEENPLTINQIPVLNVTDDSTAKDTVLQSGIPVFLGTRGVFHVQISERLHALGFSEIYPVTVELICNCGMLF